MLQDPFPLLHLFQDHLRVALFTKEDDITSDQAAAEKLGAKEAAGLSQKHGNRAVRIDRSSNRIEEADAMATNKPGLALCIRAADCQNFVVYAPKQKVAGVLHVGWRCIEDGTIRSFYDLLKREWTIDPADTFVVAGPSIGFECAEFSDPAHEMPSVDSSLINGRLIDLSGAADQQFLAVGVQQDHMERIQDCTKCHPEKYWTYRGGDMEAVKQGHTNVLACMLI